MALTAGTRLGVYEVTTQIGEGGMGQVWRARDTKLNRDVALKVLPDSFANDPDRLARFTREAQTLAALNHPNIAHIHGLEESDGMRALVMELVEGEDLSQRIARGAIPLDEALPIAKQIADALEAAHEQGIIHRDLKPANVKVRADGTVKVLDFGLAKAIEPAGASSANVMNSPTLTARATQLGMILGTAAYMAPEQARGTTVDKRADLWAFGVVLWEMLTGKCLFEGATVSDTLASVLKTEPEWNTLAPTTPSAIRRLLRRCLEKDRKRRLSDAADARLDIEEALTTPSALVEGPIASGAPRGRRVWMAALAVAAVGIVAMAVPTVRHLRETPPLETRPDILTPRTDHPEMFALSPDGRQIVFMASGDGSSRLWLRSLATTTAQPLTGTEGATFPFWKPDGRAIGFFAAGALKRLDLDDGAVQSLAPVLSGRGGTWSTDDVIVFAPSQTTPLMRVSATPGAVATTATTLGPHQLYHEAPYFLPDSRRFVFSVRGPPEATGIYLGALDGSAPTRLTTSAPDFSATGVRYLPPGWLLWTRAGTLVAQRLDVAKAALVGEPVTLADGVVAVSVAPTGLVAYRTSASNRQVTWFDRSGTPQGTVGDPDSSLLAPRVCPSDGRRVVVTRRVQEQSDIWLIDGASMSRVASDPADRRTPIWSPDCTWIVFRSLRRDVGDLYQMLTNGAEEKLLVGSDQVKTPHSWSSNGFLLYLSLDPQTAADLWVVPMVGPPTPSKFLKTRSREAYGEFSPDGQWVAYHSDESGGRPEIYVKKFVPPGPAGTAASAAGERPPQVSIAGGIMPVWEPHGKELYYLNPAGAMMAVPITVIGASLKAGAPGVLFPTHIYGGGVDAQQGRQYDVARDGRFLINTVLDSAPAPITLLQNWNPAVKK